MNFNLRQLLGPALLCTLFASPDAHAHPNRVHANSGGAPTAVDDAYTTTTGDNLSVDAPGVLANDSDPESDPLTAVLVDSSGASGKLILYADGSLEYEVATGFVGTDTFTYVAHDGTQNSAPATVTFTVEAGGILTPGAFTDEPTFLAAVAAQGWSWTQESFEDPLWPRYPQTASSVSNLGITWTGNNAISKVTAGTGPAIFGQYGFFQLPHGNYTTGTNCNTPGTCTDGWVATAETGKFVAAGIWIHCNAGQADIEFILDGDTLNPVDFGASSGLSAGSTRFFGVIDGGGFETWEVHETEGKAEDASFIFADLFSFVFAPVAESTPYGCGINPAGSLTLTSGVPQVGTTLSFGIDNPLGTQTAGALPFLSLATQPAAGFPCGLVLPGFGMAGPGASGEVLLGLGPPNPILTLFGPAWSGSGTPAPIALPIPADPGLAGFALYAQGGLLDFAPSAPVPVGLTDALELILGV